MRSIPLLLSSIPLRVSFRLIGVGCILVSIGWGLGFTDWILIYYPGCTGGILTSTCTGLSLGFSGAFKLRYTGLKPGWFLTFSSACRYCDYRVQFCNSYFPTWPRTGLIVIEILHYNTKLAPDLSTSTNKNSTPPLWLRYLFQLTTRTGLLSFNEH